MPAEDPERRWAERRRLLGGEVGREDAAALSRKPFRRTRKRRVATKQVETAEKSGEVETR